MMRTAPREEVTSMGGDSKAEDSTGTAKEAIDWSGPGDEGPEESITFGAGKLTDDEEPAAEGKAD
jgi:hypothetical protein